MQFKKDLLRVFSSNFINLLIGIVTGFVVPAFLPLGQYAYLKTFTLYLGYVGILHFGFVDGIYIKYGGKLENQIDKRGLLGEHKILILFQLIVTLIFEILGLILNDPILIAFSFVILPVNIQTLFQFLYQSLGEFSIYSKIMLLTPNLLLVINLFLIFIVKTTNSWPFIIGNIITYYIVFAGLEIYFLRKYNKESPRIYIREVWSHFKVGSFIMIGNLSSIFFYAIDRWFVKFTLPISDFAFYSFAISMVGVINTLINSVTMTFYPYLARAEDFDKLKLIKKYLLIIGVMSSGGYFVFKFIVNVLLIKYVPSLNIISILFAGYPAMIVINALYVNLYKVKKLEKKYVITVALMFLISMLLNIIAVWLDKSTLTIAFATTISFYIWYLYSAKHFCYLKHTTKEIIYLGCFLISYFLCAFNLNWLFGFIVYYITMFIFTYLIFKKELLMLIKNTLKRKAETIF